MSSQLLHASDSGFIFREVRQNHPSKYYTVKIDPAGTIAAQNWVNPESEGTQNIPTSDGGNLVLTYQEVPNTFVPGEYYPRLYFPRSILRKVNRDGTHDWIINYPDTLLVFQVTQTQDLGYFVHGRSYAGLHFFEKRDAHGQLLWKKHRISRPTWNIHSRSHISTGSFKSVLLKDGGLVFFGKEGGGEPYNISLGRTDSQGNILWDKPVQTSATWRVPSAFYLNRHQAITWIEQTLDTLALVQWHSTGHLARRQIIPLPTHFSLEYALLAQRKKGGFWMVYGTRKQSYLLQLDDNLNIIRRKAIPYYMNYIQHFGELDDKRLYFVSAENELHLAVTDMNAQISQNYICGSLLTECHGQEYRDWTIAAIRSDGKTYTTQVNTYLNFEFFLDTGRYTIRAYSPLGDWTVSETVVESTRLYQRDTTVLIVRCKNTPHLSLDIGVPSLHPCQESEYVIRYSNSGMGYVSKGILEVTLDSLIDYFPSRLRLSSYSGQTLRFDIGAVYPKNEIKLKVNLGCDSVRLGSVCKVKAVFYPDGQPALTAYSEEIVSEAKQKEFNLKATIQDSTRTIDYTLRFSHEGRDTVHWFVARDTLSAWLDPSTIEMLSSNYEYSWELVDGNILKIHFWGMILPNQPPVFVRFRVKPKPDIPKNTEIQHRIGVFLNFEPPISIHHQTLWKGF